VYYVLRVKLRVPLLVDFHSRAFRNPFSCVDMPESCECAGDLFWPVNLIMLPGFDFPEDTCSTSRVYGGCVCGRLFSFLITPRAPFFFLHSLFTPDKNVFSFLGFWGLVGTWMRAGNSSTLKVLPNLSLPVILKVLPTKTGPLAHHPKLLHWAA
jgi:hypothetical protein